MSPLALDTIKDGGFTIFKNLTQHYVRVVLEEKIIEIEPSGEVARVTTTSEKIGTASSLPLFATKFGEIKGLPEAESGVFLIVSAIVRIALPDRKDLLSPSGLVRNGSGEVIGCQGFDVNP